MTTAADGGDALSADDVGVRVVRGGMQRSLGFLLTNLLSVAGAVVLLRYLGVEDFGRYGTVMALVNVVYGISDAGLTLTGSRELAVHRGQDERRAVLAHVLTMRIVLTGVGVAGAVGFAVLADYGSQLVLGTALAGFGIFLASIQSAMLLPLSVELRNARIAFNEVLRQAVLVAAWAALAVLGAGLVPFFAAQILLGVVLLAVTPLLLARHHMVAPQWSTSRMRALLEIALPVAIANVLGILYLRILVILMSLLSDSAVEIGDYVTSTRVVELVAGLPFLLGTVILPVLTVAARDDQVRMRYINARMTETMALGGALVAIVVSFGADPIVVALGGDEYEGAVGVLQIQCLAVVTIFLASAWNQTLVGMGHVRALVVTTGAGLTAVVVAGVALIPSLDAEGAAIAAVIADLVLCVATYIALRRSGPARDLSASRLLRVALAAVPAVGVGLIPGVPDAVSALAAGVVFVVAALALRAVPTELVGAVRDLRGSRP
jgi:O-antigen/teichoic acid export membrane protein